MVLVGLITVMLYVPCHTVRTTQHELWLYVCSLPKVPDVHFCIILYFIISPLLGEHKLFINFGFLLILASQPTGAWGSA